METVPGAALLRGSGMRERHATTDTLREVIRGYNRSQLAREYPFSIMNSTVTCSYLIWD